MSLKSVMPARDAKVPYPASTYRGTVEPRGWRARALSLCLSESVRIALATDSVLTVRGQNIHKQRAKETETPKVEKEPEHAQSHTATNPSSFLPRCDAGMKPPDAQELTRTPSPHKDFSDLYEKMSGKAASASEPHRPASWSPCRPSTASCWLRPLQTSKSALRCPQRLQQDSESVRRSQAGGVLCELEIAAHAQTISVLSHMPLALSSAVTFAIDASR